MSKQLTCQKFVFKIHSSRLRNNKWNLSLPLDEARRNEEVIALADSQVLRWIDELNGIEDFDGKIKEIKSNIKSLKKSIDKSNISNVKSQIRSMYAQLDELQFKEDYMCLIIDSKKDYYRACEGFKINGVSYKRLLGTNGGIKNSTIVFVSERLCPEIARRIENDRNPDVKLVTAKLEAYKALACSASIPVSYPKGILVVNDVETHFKSDITYITDEDCDEPIVEERSGEDIVLNATDGFGMMSPSLAKRWSDELELDYVTCGVNTRLSFEKGMIFTFDFVSFASMVAGTNIVKDAWGDEVDIRNVELVLTTSMLKLWDSYDSCEDYISKCKKNGYTFGITKTCPKKLESERNLNYQFIQSYDLSDDDIDKLIAPTVNEFKDVIGGDWSKMVMFLKGSSLNDSNVDSIENDYCKALMIDHSLANDPYVRSSVYKLVKKKIDDAKVGVIKVHGNFSIVSGDPYILCQGMFGLELTGLLKPGEIYNKYWSEIGSEKLACFRAPMTTHANIRKVTPNDSIEAVYWYKYLDTCTVFNSWDTAMSALNGCDFDGDLVMLTDNDVLVRNIVELPAIMCAQRRAEKRISTEEDFIKSNIDSFGNDIGQTTNWITSMFEVRAAFDKDSDEYKTLSYRIQCGQLYQQNAIDKAKGIVCKPMPKSWHDRRSCESDDIFARNIVADKKPYFMRYIYPSLMKEYNTYISNTNRNCMREFGITVDELQALPKYKQTRRQKEFLKYYTIKMPVGTNDCLMNKICRKIEEAFSADNRYDFEGEFDYSVIKSGDEYSNYTFYKIKKIVDEYIDRVKDYSIANGCERVKKDDAKIGLDILLDEFKRKCDETCPNTKILCNILIDICYKKNNLKKLIWKLCGDEVIENLLNNNDRTICYPVEHIMGDVSFSGKRYTIRHKKVA